MDNSLRALMLGASLIAGLLVLPAERASSQTGCVTLECYHRNLGQLSPPEFARMMQLEKEEREREQARREYEQQQRYQKQREVQAQEAERQRIEQQRQREEALREQQHLDTVRKSQEQERESQMKQAQRERAERNEQVSRSISDRGYKRITTNDFLLDGDELSERAAKVAVEGIYRNAANRFSGYLFPITQTTGMAALLGANSIFDDTSKAVPVIAQSADRDARRFLLEKCEPLCAITVLGTAGTCAQDGQNEPFPCVQVESVIEK